MPRAPVRPCVEFGGEKYYRDNDGYFKSSRSRGRKLLHRDVWSAANGPIPDGWHIHHRDHDRGNNDLANLEALSAKRHHGHHGPKGAFRWSGEQRSASRASEWTAREPWPRTCRECGAEYLSRSNKPSHYCTPKCCDKAMGRKRTERQRERRAAGL
jgi:hypothetical protein